MAAKSLAGGELYFIGEKDPYTGDDTNFVKIGIVRDKDGRGTDHRVKEHQTGNPRLLHPITVITTPVVERIETTMHGLFAPSRLSGEWFFFTKDERDAAVGAAQGFIESAQKHESQMAQAENLKKAESNSEVIAASEELKDLHREVIALRAQVAACNSLAKTISDCMLTAHQGGVDFGRLLTIQEKKAIDRFNEEKFKEAYPALWAQYIVTKESFTGSFRVVDPKAERPDPFSLNVHLADLAQHIDVAVRELSTSKTGAMELHDMFLRLLTIQAPLEWQQMLAEDVAKSTLGTASEIEGLFKWAREKSLKEAFDKETLREEEPKKYAEFITQTTAKPTVVVARDRGFQLGGK